MLSALGPAAGDEAAVRAVLCKLEARSALPAGQLPAQLPQIEAAFAGKASVEEVYEACSSSGSSGGGCGTQWGADTLTLMAK